MQEFKIDGVEAGQRLDKYLERLMPKAPKSFFYKMLRKKNITLNQKKAAGNERLRIGDMVVLWLSDETISNFSNDSQDNRQLAEYRKAAARFGGVFPVVYEDAEVLIMNKPAGMLSQKAKPENVSMNEAMLGYLLEKGAITEETISKFKPGICNRLDRNTSGLLVAGLTLQASRTLNEIIKNRTIKKFYNTIAVGRLTGSQQIQGYLYKDSKTNKVTIVNEAPETEGAYKPIETVYRSLKTNGTFTLLEVELVTGRTHQIRAHLASIGHPVAGDFKYGNKQLNEQLKSQYGLKHQLLHACRMAFPADLAALPNVAGKCFTAPMPPLMEQIMAESRG